MANQGGIEAEQSAFDQHLQEMLADHAGKFVVFKDRKARGFHATYHEAYSAALDEFGMNVAFLVSEVKEHGEEAVSISWSAGVLG